MKWLYIGVAKKGMQLKEAAPPHPRPSVLLKIQVPGNMCLLDWNHLCTKDRWRSACRCFSHVLLWSSVDLSPYPHPEALLVRLHCKQAHLSVWYTLRTTSYGWWIKLLLSCSLTIHFIHKPKILLRQPIGWARALRKKTACSRQPMRGQ